MSTKLLMPSITTLRFWRTAISLRSLWQPLIGALFILFPVVVSAQTLDITHGIHTYSALNNTTVNMTGRSELHITAPNNPIPGCLINLNSSDAWFFLENIQPSAVISDHLGQIQVNGEAAVLDSNVRVVEYVMGTVVIPHSSSYTPLQVFSGSHFTGDSMQLGLYTYYRGADLGTMYNAISSFKLKRGYMATFAQQTSGGGVSRVYVAQDGDIEVSALPADLTRAIGFVRVFPWRWTGKKGWSGGAELRVNPLWNYDWNNVATSSRNVEYVPMRHNLFWNSYANINNKLDSTHVLGFNEPDRPDQANMTVATAISEWPNLMASGLRLGSPAPSDGGLAWLYNFIDQADALNYRVDYVAVHFYRGGQTATQLINWLRDIYNRTGRPLWVTEFNNGANWTCCAPSSYEQNAQIIGQFVDAMNQAPFVERYAVYNWVGPRRELIINGMLTATGVVYRDKASPNAYRQELPAGSGTNAHYLMNGDARDRTGSGNDSMLVGAPSFVPGQSEQAIKLDGVHDYVQLPANLGRASNFTFGAWVNWDGGASWQRIFDLGDGPGRYLFLTPSSSNGTLRFGITTSGSGSGQQRLDGPALTPGAWTHVAVTINGTTGKLFVNGALVATNNSMTINPAAVKTKYNYLGKSQYPADPLFAGQLDEVFFAGYALTDDQVAAMVTARPPQFTSDPIVKPAGLLYQPYSDSIAGDAIDPNGGGLSFSKIAGAAWLTVAADGGLSGTPDLADVGTNTFAVRVVNFNGAAAVTRLTIEVDARPQLVARYAFDGNTQSSVGFGADGIPTGIPAYDQGHSGQSIVLDGTNNFVTLPKGVAANWSDITVAAWVWWNGGANWQRIFDFGSGTAQYMYLTPHSGSGTLRFGIKNLGGEQILETKALPVGQWSHVAVTLSGNTGSLYVNGILAATANITIRPSDFKPLKNYIGKSQWPDPLFSGSIDEFLIYNHALSSEQIATLAADNAPSFTSNPIGRPDATPGQAYSSTIADAATDPDPGDILTFSKVSGPAWLQVESNGTLSGTPTKHDVGTNNFTVRVTDDALISSDATLVIDIPTGPPNRINLVDANGRPNGVMGVPASYVPAHQPINNDSTSRFFGTNSVLVTLANGSTVRTNFNPGLHPWRNQFFPGPFNWTMDASLFKAVRINEQVSIRFNLDFFNILNNPGLNPPDSTSGIASLQNSANTPRQMQATLRLTF